MTGAMNRNFQCSAAFSFWGLLVASWLVESWSMFDGFPTTPVLLGVALPLGTLCLAWKQQVQFLFTSAFPLSILPFLMVYPEAMSLDFHSIWTFIPLGLLWFLIISPPRPGFFQQNQPAQERDRRREVKRYSILVVWYTVGLIGIFLGSLGTDEDTVPVIRHWMALGAILWVGPWILILWYRKDKDIDPSSEEITS